MRSAPASPSGIRFVVDPRIVTGTRWVTGAERARTSRRRTSSPGVTSCPTVCSTSPTCGQATPARPAVHRSRSPEASRWATSSSWGGCTPRRSGCGCIGPDGQLVTVTMGSYGIGVSRAVAAIAETTLDDHGLCWPRQVAPADVHVVIAGKPGAEQWPAAEALAGRAGGGRVAGAARRPRLGLARREVQGRRPDRRADDRRRRPRDHRRFDRGQGPPERRPATTSRCPTRWPSWSRSASPDPSECLRPSECRTSIFPGPDTRTGSNTRMDQGRCRRRDQNGESGQRCSRA